MKPPAATPLGDPAGTGPETVLLDAGTTTFEIARRPIGLFASQMVGYAQTARAPMGAASINSPFNVITTRSFTRGGRAGLDKLGARLIPVGRDRGLCCSC